ncbi:MAG TPA: penicillin-binding protein activator [Anaeromyxobacteraceae bacterium]|nr:penicillin-binding protein activator [Anaeromyxobacteraceae bacterium]
MRRHGLVLAALALALSACPKRVTVGGKEMTEDEANALARAEIDRVRAATVMLPPARAAQEMESAAGRLGAVPAAAEAWLEAARRWREARQPLRASAALGQLLTRFPLSPLAVTAKYELGTAELEAGRARDAFQTLSTLYDKLPREKRPEAAARLAAAAEAAKLWAQAVRWQSVAAAQAVGPPREAALARVAEILDGQLSFLEVAKLREDLPSDSLALPAVQMKLARIYVHLRQFPEAEARVAELLDRWPDSAYAKDARALRDRLQRRAQVNPAVVGVAVPLSGKLQPYGEAVLQGVGLALADSPFKVVARDTRGEPDGAAQALEDLALQEGAIAVVGGFITAEAPRAAAAAQELELPFLSLSRAEKVTEAGPFVFRLMLTAQAQAQALTWFAFERRGLRRFAILYPNVPYGVELANAFWDEVQARGGEVRAAESYDYDRTTFSPLVKDMVGKLYLDERRDWAEKVREIAKEKDPYRRAKALERARKALEPIVDFDAVFIPDFAKNLALVAPALAVEDVVTSTCDPKELERIRKASGREDVKAVQLLGGNGWDDPALVERAGKYVQCSVFVDGFFAASDRPETRRFVDAFLKRYGKPPSILEASAYDAARMVRQAVERDRATTREAVRAALAGLKGFHGATGDVGFDAQREPRKPLFFLTVDKAGLRELTPQELAAPGAGGS